MASKKNTVREGGLSPFNFLWENVKKNYASWCQMAQFTYKFRKNKINV